MQTADLAAAILAIARTRDRAAFTIVFNHFAPRVKAYLMRLGTSAGEAEELVQDVLLTVWRRAETYDPAQAGVGTWVFTIARNRRIDALRREKRPSFDPDDPTLQPEPPPSPDHKAAAVEWEDRLIAAVDELPAEQGQLIRMAYYEDCSHSDIAQRLNLPLGTVKSRLRLAMARLRSKFEEQ
jgi:RNA polymerase sigma-70 factor (ECF subfamily)